MEKKKEFENMMKFAAGKRKGFNDFMEWLNDTDFFTAPASANHHGASEGMLLCHSLNVCERLLHRAKEAKQMGISMESMVIVALLHDVCKIDRYIPKKDEDGIITGYEYNKATKMPVGHGERSIIMIQQQGMTLTMEELTAIRWHMGAWDDAVRGGDAGIYQKHIECIRWHSCCISQTWKQHILMKRNERDEDNILRQVRKFDFRRKHSDSSKGQSNRKEGHRHFRLRD